MSKILVTYTTNAGSTAEVAEAVGTEIRAHGHQVDVVRLEDCRSVEGYAAVIVGAPMILGWRRSALAFVKKHRAALQKIPVAYFCTLMSLTEMTGLPGEVAVDPWLPKPPKHPGRLSIKENYATPANYLRPLQQAAPEVHPRSIAFLGGKLELFRLKWWQMLFVMVIIQAPPGDLRNWDFIQGWAGEFADRYLSQESVTG